LPRTTSAVFVTGHTDELGTLVLHRVVPDQFDELYELSRGDYPQLVRLCRERLDIDPPQVAAALADKWQFPPLLARPIALHH